MALEAHVLDAAFAIDRGMDLDMVAAKRIVTLGVAVRAFERAEIARTPAVVENHFLIEIAQIRAHEKISITF